MNEKSPSFSLERAKAAVLSRDFDLAKRIYNQILRAEPDNFEVLNYLAGVHVKTGEDGVASLFFLKALRLDSENFTALDNLGGIYRRLGRNEESLEILAQALKTGKNSAQIHYNMGQTYKQMSRYTEAEDCFMAVIDDNPNDVLAYNHLGCIYQLKNEHKKAIQTFRRALEIDPNHPILHYNTALSYENLKKYDDAAKSYENTLRSRPGWSMAMVSYADLLARTKRFDNAELILEQAKRFGISDPKLHNLQARLHYVKKDLPAAESEFRKAIEANPKDVSSLAQLGSLFELQNKGIAALRMYEKLEILEPLRLDVKQQVVKLLMRNNEAEKAEDRLKKLENANPDDITTLSLQGQWNTLMGDEKSARAYFDRIAKIEPENIQFRKELAETLSYVDKFEEAEINLRRYLSEKPDDPDAWFKIGKIYESLNEIKKALTSYRKLLSLEPLNSKLEEAVSALCKKTKGDPEAMRLMSDVLDARSKNAENGSDLERMLASYEQLAAMSVRSTRLDRNLKKQSENNESDAETLQSEEDLQPADESETTQNSHELTIEEELRNLDLELHTGEEEENELDFSSIQENLDDFMEEINNETYDSLVAQDAPLDSDMLPEASPAEFGSSRNSEPLEEEEVLDLGEMSGQDSAPDEIEDREEIEEVEDQRLPEYPKYPEYPVMPPEPVIEEELVIEEEPEVESVAEEPISEEEPEPVAEEPQSIKKIHEALAKARETVPATEDASTLEMFEYIRGLCSHLPPIKKEAFEGNENRMYLEYIINKLKGKPGLMTETKMVEDLVPQVQQASQDVLVETPITSDSIGNAFGYLRTLSFELSDKKLASVLDGSVAKMLSRWDEKKKGDAL